MLNSTGTPLINRVDFCVSANEYFWEWSYIIHAIAIVVSYLSFLGVMYMNNVRIWLGLFVVVATASSAKILQDYILLIPKPYPQCVPDIIMRPLNVSKNGVPEANFVYLISMIIVSIYVYGFSGKRRNSYARLRLCVAYVITIIFLCWIYYHTWQLTILQIFYSLAYAILGTLIFIQIFKFLSGYLIIAYKYIKSELLIPMMQWFKLNLYTILPE